MHLEEPLGKFAYINECIKLNKTPEYIIVESPSLEVSSDLSISGYGFKVSKSTMIEFDGKNAPQMSSPPKNTLRKQNTSIFEVEQQDNSRRNLFTSQFVPHMSISQLYKKHSLMPNKHDSSSRVIQEKKSQKSLPTGSFLTIGKTPSSETTSINTMIFNIASFNPTPQEQKVRSKISQNKVHERGKVSSLRKLSYDPAKEFLNYLNNNVIPSGLVRCIEGNGAENPEEDIDTVVEKVSDGQIYNRQRSSAIGISNMLYIKI
jgi:hypothetical protein